MIISHILDKLCPNFNINMKTVELLNTETDPIGKALNDFMKNGNAEDLIIYSEGFDEDKMEVSLFFRQYNDMPQIEKKALNNCNGKILDVGAAAGCHSLFLQDKGFYVDSIDISPLSVKCMKDRGVKNAVHINFFDIKEKYDTILLLMNGIGICQRLERLEETLLFCKTILNKEGRIIFDSSDLKYLFEEEDGSFLIDVSDGYYGEINFRIKYKDILGKQFDWVYIDKETISDIASECGFKYTLLEEDNHYAYSAMLELI